MQAYERLEYEWAAFNQLDPIGMVACASGTAALHLALQAMRLRGEIIMPDYTMVACARAATLAGMTPVFVDCDSRLCLSTFPYSVEVERETIKAALPVHIYGRYCDMDYIIKKALARRVVEDLAEAHGVRPHEDTDAACWSFYKNKIVAGEEGGAVWFRDPEHARHAKQLRSLGFTDAHDYTHVPYGHNYRMSDVHAELILRSLSNFHENVLRRRQAEAWYEEQCPAEWRMPERQAPWVYDIRIPGLTWLKQTEIVIALQRAGIAARFGFKPMTLQEEYASCRKVGGENARRAGHEIIYLPLTPGQVTPASARQAFEAIKQCVG